MAKVGYKKSDIVGYSQEYDKINLQTSTTNKATIYYLLSEVSAAEIVDKAVAKDMLFPVARSKVQSVGSDWDPSKPDEHTTLTLEELGLIEYVDETHYRVSDIGKMFLQSFRLKKSVLASGKYGLDIEDAVSADSVKCLLFALFTGVRKWDERYGRDIHPYAILIWMLLEDALNGYITKREWAWFLNNSAWKVDAQRREIVSGLMQFRNGDDDQQLKKSDRLLTMLKAWGVLDELGGSGDRTSYSLNARFRKVVVLIMTYEKYLTAIRTKPFILLAGISGTGKSRIVRQLARGCCPEQKAGQPHPLINEQKPGNFELISVRPNWHDSTELMGYVTRITETDKPKYVLTPFVKFLVKAWLHKDVPFFLCLDEMNLAPVEQYFAEYLSKIETRKLSGGEIVTDVLVEFNDEVCESAIEELLKPYKPAAGSPIPPEVTVLENAMKADKGIRIPPNLVVMGTVNMDETTCSFSRKVLDRAMSFELNDVEDMYTISTDGDPNVAWGAFNNGVVNRAKQTYVTAENLYAETDATKNAANMAIGEKVLAYLKAINAVLDKTPFKVAYRTRNEMMLYCVERGGDLAKALDEVTSMKILSRIEGDENVVRVTNKLVESAAVAPTSIPNGAPKNLIQLLKLVILKQLGVVDGTVTNAAVAPSSQEYEALEGKYKICASKLDEMNDRLLSGYTGFWR